MMYYLYLTHLIDGPPLSRINNSVHGLTYRWSLLSKLGC